MFAKALAYMGLKPGQPHQGTSRERRVPRQLHERAPLGPAQRRAACFADGKIASGVHDARRPGSQQVKREAEAEGLDRVFIEAGAEWRESGLLDVPRYER